MVVDATVSSVVTRLAPIIEKKVREELNLLINSPDEADQLASSFKRIQKVLNDADPVRMTDQDKSLLDKLKDISYDIEDALDEWDWQKIKIQTEDTFGSSSSDNPWEKVISFLQSVCLCYRNVVERRSVNLNIKQLNERLHELPEENRNEFIFLPNVSSHNSQDSKRTPTTSRVDVNEVHGRDNDTKEVVSMLLSESSSHIGKRVPVISIVGVGGMGKTTLAGLVLKDHRIKDHFQEKIWVCVSDPFNECQIAKAILEALKQDVSNSSNFEKLLDDVEKSLSGKNFLLVLDDVWSHNENKWEPLRISLNNIGDSDSRILVTTRNTEVAKRMGSSRNQIHQLQQISDSDCWTVLSEKAFFGRSQGECENLESIGLKIVEKCKGLPLAAKTIGGLLCFKTSVQEWQEVLESPLWEIEEVQKEIFAPVALSYDELHPVAKRCFSYCAIFPKDTIIHVDKLIRMWCAQGFLSSITRTSDNDMDRRGRKVFDDLAMRSFFQDLNTAYLSNHVYACSMHDIVHDFAQFSSQNECLIVQNVDGGATTSAHTQGARHLNLLIDEHEGNINSLLTENEKCRSFLTTRYDIRQNLFRHLKKVRVLVLKRCRSEAIPSELGSLIHLKYLDLSLSKVRELPEVICDLYNLETLNIQCCGRLSTFPQGIHKLSKLRHIENNGCGYIEFPEGMEKLTNLQTLREIHASPGRNWKNLEVLRNMNKLGDDVRIYVEGLEEEDADKHHLLVAAAEKADLKNKKFILELTLSCMGKIPFRVVEALQPHPNLKKLSYEGPCFPKWLTTLTNLRFLATIHTSGDGESAHDDSEMASFSTLFALGKPLRCLEYLWLQDIHGMTIPNREGLSTTFPILKELGFVGCKEWEEWEDISEEQENNTHLSIFPSLEKLTIHNSPKLNALPHRLLRKAKSLKNIEIWDCDKLDEIYEDWERVSQIYGISHIASTMNLGYENQLPMNLESMNQLPMDFESILYLLESLFFEFVSHLCFRSP